MRIPELHTDSFTLAPGGKYFAFQAEDGYFHFYDTEQQLKLCTHDRRETHGNEVIQHMELAIADHETALTLAILIRQKMGLSTASSATSSIKIR